MREFDKEQLEDMKNAFFDRLPNPGDANEVMKTYQEFLPLFNEDMKDCNISYNESVLQIGFILGYLKHAMQISNMVEEMKEFAEMGIVINDDDDITYH